MTRLVLDFASEEKLAEFVEDMRYNGVIPKDSAAYMADGLDGSRVTQGETYILKRVGDRPESFRLVIKTVETTERAV